MQNVQRIAVLSLFALTVAGCSGDTIGESLTAPESALAVRNSSAASGPITRPAGGKCRTTIVPDFSQISSGILMLEIAGVCELKHLGRTTMTAQQTVYVFTGDIVNTAVYTAANGDSFTSTFVGTDPTGTAVFTGTEEYSGGTGRFVGVTGHTEIEGSANLTLWVGQFTMSGWIRY